MIFSDVAAERRPVEHGAELVRDGRAAGVRGRARLDDERRRVDRADGERRQEIDREPQQR